MAEQHNDDPSAQLQELHRLRGRFLDAMAGMESLLDLALACYFVSAPRTSEFRGRVLRWIRLSEKVNVFAAISRERDVEFLHQLVVGMRKLIGWRNLLAHGGLSLDWEADRLTETMKWTIPRWRGDTYESRELRAEDVERCIRAADALGVQLLAIASVVARELGEFPAAGFPLVVDWEHELKEAASDGAILTVSRELLDRIPTVGEENPVPEPDPE